MSQINVDSTISAHLPSIYDSELHANMRPVVNVLTSGTGVADTCGVYVSDDEDENDGDEPEPVNNPAAPPLLLTAAPLAVLPLHHRRSAAPLPVSASRLSRATRSSPG